MNLTGKETLLEIINTWPVSADILIENGFPQLKDEAKRERFAGRISLETALQLKGIDKGAFLDLLNERIGGDKTDRFGDKTVRLTGLLPCPVRLPLQEGLDEASTAFTRRTGTAVQMDMRAASSGTSWLTDSIDLKDPGSLPELFISAGFDLFFNKDNFGKYRNKGVFTDRIGFDNRNPSFSGMELADPKGYYSMLAVVPAVFLVNTDELGDRPVPRNWPDIWKPEFQGSVSLPVGDFDLFNALLLTLYREYGMEAVDGLRSALFNSMHPSQMVKSDRMKGDRPCVTIMPYFFSKMVKDGGSLQLVWPEDGAVLSPIFLLSKSGPESSSEDLREFYNFFQSRDTAEILALQGLFPTLHPEVDNNLPEGARFKWVGWEYLEQDDMDKLIARLIARFEGESIQEAAV